MTEETKQQDSAPSAEVVAAVADSNAQVAASLSTSLTAEREAPAMSGESIEAAASNEPATSTTEPTSASADAPAVAEPGEGVAPAADASSTADSASAMPASTGDILWLSVENSLVDDTRSFEQRVEDRFLQLEGFLMRLPRSIHHAMSQGSADVEEFAGRVVAHLFSKE